MKPNTQATDGPDIHFVDDDRQLSDERDGIAHKPESHVQYTQVKDLSFRDGITHNKTRDIVILSLVIVGIIGAAVACWLIYQQSNPTESKNKKTGPPPPVVTVTTVQARVRPVDEVLSVTGTVTAWDELKVGSELSGLRVKAVNVEEGDRVKKGQVLAELNGGLLAAQLAQAKARLKSSEANLTKAVQPNRPEDIASLKSALSQSENNVLQEEAHRDQAKINLASAELNVPRYDGLAKIGAVSIVEAETKRNARDNAKLELASADQKVAAAKRLVEQAQQKLLMALRGGRQEDVLMMKATVEEMKAQIKHLSEQIKQTVVRAPDDGVILKREVHIGDTSDISKPMFLMSRQARLELKAQVTDTELHKFKPGQAVTISTDESKGSITGHVRLISPQVDATSRLGTVRIDLPEGVGLKPGMFVRGEVSLLRHDGLTVPVNCMVTRGGDSFVFTLVGNRAVRTDVVIGMQTNELVEIRKGISEGQSVIDKGARFLSDRDVVDVAR